MQTISLALEEVVAAESRYRLPGRGDNGIDLELAASVAAIGLIEPIVVHEVAPGQRHVVDGMARWAAVREAGRTRIDCRVLPADTPPEEAMRLHFLAHRSRILDSAVSRVRFLDLASRNGVGDRELRDRFLPMVGFEAHHRLVRRCEAVARLPEPALSFCHEKRFSLRQCVHLTRHPAELLEWLFQRRDRLALTASIVGELAEHIRDYLRASGLQTVEFTALPAIREVMQADLPAQERTRALRQTVRALRFPMLTEIQATLETIRRGMNLPKGVELRWDPSLEQRAVEIRIRVQDGTTWSETLKRLSSPETETGLHAILERL